MKYIAIIIGKLIAFAGKLLNRGSSLPGKIALKIDKNLLSKLKYPEVRIAVTGSSGKGRTSSLIANTLKINHKVCFNNAGSNLAWGTTSSFLKNMSLTGKIKADYLVMEVDERYTKVIFKDVKPTHIVITNLTKDQPPRQHNIDIVYQDILQGINSNAKIITNMDDPYLRNFAKDLPNENLYYSISKNKYSYKNQIFENLNIYHCPYCHALLDYSYYNFETLGNYKCPSCSFKYEEPKAIANNLDLTKKTFTINNKEISIGGDMLYHAYNTLAAYTTLKDLSINENDIIKSLNKLNDVSSPIFINNNKEFYPISAKAENATTFNQSVFKVMQDKRQKDIIIGWKEISRRYKHYDLSWLYDIEFELLNNNYVNKFYACGIDADNIKKRLILAGITGEKIVTAEDIPSIKEDVIKDKVDIVYGILNFDYVEPFNITFKEGNHD
ncbi:MAG: MurT ligase domain-containing protein [Ruminococcus sp.]|nr:MurT ligase domain-containing protein [Ruminococcus sp.]